FGLPQLELGDGEIVESLYAIRVGLDRLLENVDRFARSAKHEERDTVIDRPLDLRRIGQLRQSERLERHLRASRLEERGTRRRAQERSFAMSVGRRQEDARRLLLEARPGEEIRFHPERSEVPGAVREVRLARGDGTVVIASRSQ